MQATRVYIVFALLSLALSSRSAASFANHAEHGPLPDDIVRALDTALPPRLLPDPTGRFLLIVERASLPSLAELSQPSVAIDGIRFNSKTHARAGPRRYAGITLVNVQTAEHVKLSFPSQSDVGAPVWSPDGERFAFTLTSDAGVALWVGESRNGDARAITEPVLNAILGRPFLWMPDGQRILYRQVPPEHRRRSRPHTESKSPRIRDSRAASAAPSLISGIASRDTERYFSSQLKVIDLNSGLSQSISAPGVLDRVQVSPDGTVLLVARRTASESNEGSGPQPTIAYELWDMQGRTLKILARQAAQQRGRLQIDTTQPRGFRWRPTAPATVIWFEAESADAPGAETSAGDRLMQLDPPYTGAGQAIARVVNVLTRVFWLEGDERALLTEYERGAGIARTWLVELGAAPDASRLAWERQVDGGSNEGFDVMTREAAEETDTVAVRDGSIYLMGSGPVHGRDAAFVDRLRLATLARERLWQSAANGGEKIIAALPGDRISLLLAREDSLHSTRVYAFDAETGAQRLVFANAATEEPVVFPRVQTITYLRRDDIALSAVLYLPPAMESGRRLPLIISGYPYVVPTAAARRAPNPPIVTADFRRAPYRLLALRGYAVLDRAAIPIVGDPATANDSFVEQVVMGAEAAIDAAVALGIADKNRVGIIGHSYGAFMVGNLLAQSRLFKAGVAMSGAYNRTLTPFGFQTERRKLWQARETYLEVSPFLFADRIGAPLLLIHGALDDYPATPPRQSEMLYEAIEDQGGRARLVILPYEGHTYRAKESLVLMMREIGAWFDSYVKGAEPGAAQITH